MLEEESNVCNAIGKAIAAIHYNVFSVFPCFVELYNGRKRIRIEA